MWRDADIEARHLKSNALVARDVRDQSTDCRRGWSFALRALAAALRAWPDCGGVRNGTDEILTIRLQTRLVHAEMRTSFFGHHVRATFELRAGAVKAAARRVERSESLDRAEHGSILIVVMADFWRERSLRSTTRFASDLWPVRA